jgi:hypothetical protein
LLAPSDLLVMTHLGIRTALVGVLVTASSCGASEQAPLPEPRELAPVLTLAMARCLPSGVGGTSFTAQQVLQVEQELLLAGPGYPHGVAAPALSARQLRCIVDAGGDCDAVRACLGVTLEVVSTCASTASRCDGTTRVFCTAPEISSEPPLVIREDCAAIGRMCAMDGDRAVCATARCTSPDLTVRCDGDHLASCSNGLERDSDCRAGTTCSAAAGGCVGAGETCTADVCEGSVFVPCDSSNHRTSTRIDCAAFGYHCMEFPSLSTAGCAPPDAGECHPESASCDGDVLRYCAADRTWHTFDCVAHGYAACDPTFASGITPNGCVAFRGVPTID